MQEKEKKMKRFSVPTPKLTKEEKEERKASRLYYRRLREELKEEKKREAERKRNVKRELAVLTYMKKNDVKYYHHSCEESMKKAIIGQINSLKEKGAKWEVYDPYIWNYKGEGNNCNSRCLLGNLWSSSREFPTIYDVPLDGTYQFVITDSGQRGSGSYNYMKPVKTGEEVYVPKVNPGAFRGFSF